MKTIIINGSPKGNIQSSGSYFIAKAFVSGMNEPCEIHAIAEEKGEKLLDYVKEFDRIILITPNYIHSVPSETLEFLYGLPKAAPTQAIGFIIQSGYPESSESEIMCRFFKKTAQRLGYDYLGTVVKGECAGIAIMPKMFKKLGKQFEEFGRLYEQTGSFDENFVRDFAKPYLLSKSQMRLINVTSPIGNIFGWNKILKKNHAYEKRKDMPYLD